MRFILIWFYGGVDAYKPISHLIGDVPAISLQGISKELPWPGARCGWITVYNRNKNKNFNSYIDSIINAKMLEVCSTTLPQKVIPKIFQHLEFSLWQSQRRNFFKERSDQIKRIFSDCPNVIVNEPHGAFYVSIVFRKKINSQMKLKIKNTKVYNYIQGLLSQEEKFRGDFSFVYQLLGSKNICVVPLSSFVTDLEGFRCTLLERDDKRFEYVCYSLVEAIQEFFA